MCINNRNIIVVDLEIYYNAQNAIKTQILDAISIYVLVAIIKKELKLDQSLYTIVQVLSVTLFEKILFYKYLQIMITQIHQLCLLTSCIYSSNVGTVVLSNIFLSRAGCL